MKKILGIAIALVLLAPAFPVALAQTYYGPSLSVTSSVTSGMTVTMSLVTGSGSTFTAPPTGSDVPCNPADPSTCSFPLQSCPTGSFNYYQINQATVTDPNGNEYMLGSATTSGLTNPSIGRFTGSTGNYPTSAFAPAINVSSTDSGSIPFGTAAGDFFALTSNLPNPPNNVNPEGPYYWWTVTGNANGAGLRLDQTTIQPTSTVGTYTFDLEGLVFCTGSSPIFFDAALQFTVFPAPPPSTGVTRTIGFWKTHLAFMEATWSTYIAANPSGASICGLTITTAAQAMGVFWASNSKLSDGAHRGQPGQAEMILAKQWVGALLNTVAFGTSDGGLLAAGQTACNTDNVSLITTAATALEAFNTSGDSLGFTGAGSATPAAAAAFANIPFWDAI